MRFFFKSTQNPKCTKGKEKKMYESLKRSVGVLTEEEEEERKGEGIFCRCVFVLTERESVLNKYYNDRQLPQHVRRVRVRVPVPAVFMFQGMMRKLSLVVFALLSWWSFDVSRSLF